MKAQFLLSTLTEFPTLKNPKGDLLPEIALVGKSNVGKSSLINHLFQEKKLARTSATPGKTQLLNFFLVDDLFLLVDLPGYGFAKAPLEEVAKWGLAIDTYLNTRSTLRLILLLIDSRRGITQEDESLLSWSSLKKIPVLLIFTKTDKLSSQELKTQMKKYPDALHYSILTQHSRPLLEKKIQEALWD